ncbi:MAG: MFS transporter [Chloroflexi bacterium]|nr:MFS transporter [Chloroflexota bacterium]
MRVQLGWGVERVRAEKATALAEAPLKVSQEHYKWMVLAVVELGNIVTTIDTSIINFALPTLASAMHTDISTIVWVSLAYILVNAGLLFTLGWLSDHVGRGRLFLLGLLIHGVLLLPLAFSQNVFQMVAGRVGQGIGASMIHANTVALVASAFPDRERGKALGILGAVAAMGMGIGPLMGGLILDHFHWRALFYLRIPIFVAVFLITWLYMERGSRRSGRLTLDWLGAVLLFGGLVSLLLGVNRAGKLGLAAPMVLGTFMAAAVLLPAFVYQERRSASPILDLKLFRRRVFAGTATSLVIQFQGWNIVSFVVPFLLVQGLAFSPSRAGVFLSVYSLVRIVSPVTGWLSDRVRAGAVAAFGLALMLAGLILLSRVRADTPDGLILSALAVAGLGAAFFGPSANSILAGSVPREQLGTASAAVAEGRQIGMSSGTAIAGAVLATRSAFHARGLAPDAATPPPDAVTLAAGDAFLVGAGLTLIALVVALVSALPQRGEPAQATRRRAATP